MKKSILMILFCTVLLTGCSCQHEWTDADCTAPRTCVKCDATEGEALGHTWLDANCVAPKTCSRCGLTEGAPLGHTWSEATCTTAKTCSNCAVTEGEPLGHTWEGEATLFAAPVCAICAMEGDPLPGYFAQNGLVPDVYPGLAAEYSTNTYVRPDLETTGQFLVTDFWITDSDKTHRARPGHEWRCADITISFNGNLADLYGANVSFAMADYYSDHTLKKAKKQENFAVTYNDKKYYCTARYENAGFYYTDEGMIYQVTCYFLVPIGYDGVVLAFPHGSIDLDGQHLHELDGEVLLFRLE